MPDEYQQSPRIKHVQGDAIYNYYEAPPRKPFRPGRWPLLGGLAVLLLGGATLATTHHKAGAVYYCASTHAVKYHVDPDCRALRQCGGEVKTLTLREAHHQLQPCKMCH